ncbi:MAG: histidine ammonia-lyase [Flavobacteriaceae bacterium]|nr:histidine ammonia-lyase [Bacteroidia bacterium]MBT8288089.1 histidine ammonia-lyase [Bacteroidia bacterium]NNF73867.1 histidine ammonia-lyase [Flavobacteriaceae bacterium]NNK71820.1 histidine ammonia-lyase [Flavobacteriaceae bacterium]
MSDVHLVSPDPLDLETIHNLIRSNSKLKLSDECKGRILRCRQYLDKRLSERDRPFYGINTGFGSLHNVKINDDNLSKLQRNLMLSHACGTGDHVPEEIIKIMLWSKIRSLSYGHSGVQLETVNRLIDFYNNDIYPVVYTQGSLGASGDLAPLAHLCLPLLGEGEVWFNGEIVKAETILDRFGWAPIELRSKEGLALLNGTQFMSSYGIYLLIEAKKISYLADLISSISLDAYNGSLEPFFDLVHMVRPHNGQLVTARRVRSFLEGSELMLKKKQNVQDPYSFRCIPQVHGATFDTIKFIERTFITEVNAVTDNPNIFAEDDEIISGGNFHGQPLAFAFDFLKIAMAELGNISERRTFQLVSGQRELPDFLVDNPGLNSGFMIPQYTAASIVSANKQLATPASIDSIVSSNGQEDHVSMGANAAVQAKDLIDNVKRILAIELFNASQALFFREPMQSSPFIIEFLKAFRKEVPFITEDQFLRDDIAKSIAFLNDLHLDNTELFFV